MTEERPELACLSRSSGRVKIVVVGGVQGRRKTTKTKEFKSIVSGGITSRCRRKCPCKVRIK